MFTGLVSAMGHIVGRESGPGLIRFTVEAPYHPDELALGASVAHDGCCLTVVATAPIAGGVRYDVEVAQESLNLTTLGRLQPGGRVNLERSLKLGDELGGHMVSGHVDGLGTVRERAADGAGWRLWIEAPATLAPLIAPKGSIAVNGVSLTVNAVEGTHFGVLIIPHTWAVTTLSGLNVGDQVNLEADLIARYVARLAAFPVSGAAMVEGTVG